MLEMGFHAIGVQHPFGQSLKVKYFWRFIGSGGSVACMVETGNRFRCDRGEASIWTKFDAFSRFSRSPFGPLASGGAAVLPGWDTQVPEHGQSNRVHVPFSLTVSI